MSENKNIKKKLNFKLRNIFFILSLVCCLCLSSVLPIMAEENTVSEASEHKKDNELPENYKNTTLTIHDNQASIRFGGLVGKTDALKNVHEVKLVVKGKNYNKEFNFDGNNQVIRKTQTLHDWLLDGTYKFKVKVKDSSLAKQYGSEYLYLGTDDGILKKDGIFGKALIKTQSFEEEEKPKDPAGMPADPPSKPDSNTEGSATESGSQGNNGEGGTSQPEGSGSSSGSVQPQPPVTAPSAPAPQPEEQKYVDGQQYSDSANFIYSAEMKNIPPIIEGQSLSSQITQDRLDGLSVSYRSNKFTWPPFAFLIRPKVIPDSNFVAVSGHDDTEDLSDVVPSQKDNLKFRQTENNKSGQISYETTIGFNEIPWDGEDHKVFSTLTSIPGNDSNNKTINEKAKINILATIRNPENKKLHTIKTIQPVIILRDRDQDGIADIWDKDINKMTEVTLGNEDLSVPFFVMNEFPIKGYPAYDTKKVEVNYPQGQNTNQNITIDAEGNLVIKKEIAKELDKKETILEIPVKITDSYAISQTLVAKVKVINPDFKEPTPENNTKPDTLTPETTKTKEEKIKQFKKLYETVLALDIDTVKASHKEVIQDALNDLEKHYKFSELSSIETKLKELYAKAQELEDELKYKDESRVYYNKHQNILNKQAKDITLSDKEAINQAKQDFEKLPLGVQNVIPDLKERIESFEAKIKSLEKKVTKVITHNPNWQQDLRKHNEFINKTQPKTSLPNTGYVSNHSILLASTLLTLVAYKLYKKED